MLRIIYKIFIVVFKKLHKKKQPTIKAVNSVVIININKD